MIAICEFVLSSLEETFGRDMGLLLAWISCFFLILAFFAPVYLLIKALRYRSITDGPKASSSADVFEPVISSPASAEVPESRQEFIQTLESVKRGTFEIYKILTYAIVTVLTAVGIYFASVATAANGLILFAFWSFAGAAIIFSQMERFKRLMTWKPSINITRTCGPQ